MFTPYEDLEPDYDDGRYDNYVHVDDLPTYAKLQELKLEELECLKQKIIRELTAREKFQKIREKNNHD